ncbi:MAG: hypothetical protein FWC51_00625 [Proteobacteria bacterium]|nr:hypothetical protein [Pseudomonadota bacterium]
MSFNKIAKTIALAGIIAVAGIASAHADTLASSVNICGLVAQMGGVFKTLRVLAFVGAAFSIAGWAWGYISSGSIGEKGKSMEEVKNKGTALIVGFVLLFGVGLLLSFLMSNNGMCAGEFKTAF